VFDVARSGYINLLQPQDRRSRQPGDSAAVRAARRRSVARGLAAPLLEAILDLVTIARDDAVLDVGCGEGDVLAALAGRFGCEAHGVDIAVAAIDAAAKRYPRGRWIVANADRALPYAPASFRLVTSVTARMNPVEFRRVVHGEGRLVVVVPAPDDLIELREAVHGHRVLRDRVARTVTAFAPHFALARHRRVRHHAHLDPAALTDALTSAYRALRTSERGRLAAVGALDVTLAHDVLAFRPGRAAAD
jgi:23S rRNA (guanine745-N1)-methyltransferase